MHWNVRSLDRFWFFQERHLYVCTYRHVHRGDISVHRDNLRIVQLLRHAERYANQGQKAIVERKSTIGPVRSDLERQNLGGGVERQHRILVGLFYSSTNKLVPSAFSWEGVVCGALWVRCGGRGIDRQHWISTGEGNEDQFL